MACAMGQAPQAPGFKHLAVARYRGVDPLLASADPLAERPLQRDGDRFSGPWLHLDAASI